MSEKAKLAQELHTQGYNCAQAVFCAFAEDLGLDLQTARRLMEGFGAGMGLPNMKKYTDTMKIDTEVGVGTTVTMTVNVT